MQLHWFHRVLIASAIVFAAGMAVHQFVQYRRAGERASLLYAAAFLAIAASFALYLRRKVRAQPGARG